METSQELQCQIQAAISVVASQTYLKPSLAVFAHAISCLTTEDAAFRIYVGFSHLRESQIRTVLQYLLSRAGSPGIAESRRKGLVAAAVRAVAVLRAHSEIILACEELRGIPNACWNLRLKALFAFFARAEARHVLNWSDTFVSAVQARVTDADKNACATGVIGVDRSLPTLSEDERELRAASDFVLGTGNTSIAKFLPPALSWSEQILVCNIRQPSLWREIAWADFAQRCSLGQVLPSIPQHLSENEFANDVSDFSASDAPDFDDDPSYVNIYGVRLKRRMLKTKEDNPFDITGNGCDENVRTATKIVPGYLNFEPLSSDMDICREDRQRCEFVETESVKRAGLDVVTGLASSKPVLLEGSSGCGKSSLIEHIALRAAPLQVLGLSSRDDESVIRIQLDSITSASADDDASALVGCVVPLGEGGGFQWRPGPIGMAVERGSWLVLENLPSGTHNNFVTSLVSELSRLRPGDAMEVPGRGMPLHVAHGFAVIATRAISSDEERNPLSSDWEPPGTWAQWRRITMTALSESDISCILHERFVIISDCIARVLNCIRVVKEVLIPRYGDVATSLSRLPDMRDAVKLCRRLESLRKSSPRDCLTPETAFLESVDVLCAWESDKVVLSTLHVAISNAWSVSPDVANTLTQSHTPSYSLTSAALSIGRSFLQREGSDTSCSNPSRKLALTGHTLRLLEQVSRAVEMKEDVVLCGESGTGKTACVQEIANMLGKKLVVVNMSRNSDIGDLIGSYRPLDMRAAVTNLARDFETAFCGTMSRDKNGRFLHALRSASRHPSKYIRALRLMRGAINALPKTSDGVSRLADKEWISVHAELCRIERRIYGTIGNSFDEYRTACRSEDIPSPKKRKISCLDGTNLEPGNQSQAQNVQNSHENNSAPKIFDFEFVEGALTSAMRKGHWILMDELNLAPVEVLERLVGLLDDRRIQTPDSRSGSVCCGEGFALFAAMNPPTDTGKRPLPKALRTRFTEFNVTDCHSREDIALLCRKRFFGVDCMERRQTTQETEISYDIAEFYLRVRESCDRGIIFDGTARKSRYSLRSLTRMLEFASAIAPLVMPVQARSRKALYEGAELAFVTPLPNDCRETIRRLAMTSLLKSIATSGNGAKAGLSTEWSIGHGKKQDIMINPPKNVPCAEIAGFYLERGHHDVQPTNVVESTAHPTASEDDDVVGMDPDFVVTESVERTLRDVCRALVIGAPRLPILLQGPTAAGKTSLIAYLAKMTSRKLVRINNHEHTDISEYLGTYVATSDGSLAFQEGPIIRAARSGDWVVLDELNLAPPDILEALNRLLDDNREIRIPETGECVRPEKGFTLFATQNPPGLYGGRKELSNAFRGRFIEVHVDELPDSDLKTILLKRAKIPSSFAESMISVMRDLQSHRRSSQMFHGKGGFITARDLFRWASRFPRSREDLAVEGFFLLGERSRFSSERKLVRDVLIKHTGVSPDTLSDENLYSISSFDGTGSEHASKSMEEILSRRVLSVATLEGIALTPSMLRMLMLLSRCAIHGEPGLLVGGTGCGKTTACHVMAKAMDLNLCTVNCHKHTEASDFIGSFRPSPRNLPHGMNTSKLFEWVDGPLVSAMKMGHVVLVDEINMADDAVTERLNPVLESDRTILLSEKGCALNDQSACLHSQHGAVLSSETVTAVKSFKIFATMNPGGDYGKKELSPALRNRFTEIWIPVSFSRNDYAPIVYSRLFNSVRSDTDECIRMKLRCTGDAIVEFVSQSVCVEPEASSVLPPNTARASSHLSAVRQYPITLRDISSWADCVREFCFGCNLDPLLGFVHGARLVMLDGLAVGSTTYGDIQMEQALWRRILDFVPAELQQSATSASFEEVESFSFLDLKRCRELRVGPFLIPRSAKLNTAPASGCNDSASCASSGFCFSAKTTMRNVARIARAMALKHRPILLEGPPGSGKSSVVEAIASQVCSPFIRVNLSEHTEMSDLIGGFVPSGERGSFAFKNGPLLTALLEGQWILLDELNLASQSVLEGLNAVLDHRRSVHVPELGREFIADNEFRVFGAQNAAHGGCGRRSLPRSFLNRFTRVAVQPYCDEDMKYIASKTHPKIDSRVISDIVRTLMEVNSSLASSASHLGSSGEEFNLRDVLRWCDLLDGLGDQCWEECGNVRGGIQKLELQLRETLSHPSEPILNFPSIMIPDNFFDAVVLQRLRSADHAKVACEAFYRIFGRQPKRNPVPMIRISQCGRHLRVGTVTLQRGSFSRTLFDASHVPSEGERLDALEALALATAANWPVIVSSGWDHNNDAADSVELVRVLAALSGRELLEININNASDSGDLLGGYSQCDSLREFYRASSMIIHAFDSILRAVLCSESRINDADAISAIEDLEILRGQIVGNRRKPICHGEMAMSEVLQMADIIGSTTCFEKILQDKNSSDKSDLTNLCVRVKIAIARSSEFCQSSDAFEWRKSALIEAVERGVWVLIRDADRCPAAVLDRLNPVFERPPLAMVTEADRSKLKQGSGRLFLHEAPPDQNGTPQSVSIHSDFRLFMTTDERRTISSNHGLSMALRNRSLQICLNYSLPDKERHLSLVANGLSNAEAIQVRNCLNNVSVISSVSAAMGERIYDRVAENLRSMYAYRRNYCSDRSVRMLLSSSLSSGGGSSRLEGPFQGSVGPVREMEYGKRHVSPSEKASLAVVGIYGLISLSSRMAVGCSSTWISRDLSIVRLAVAACLTGDAEEISSVPSELLVSLDIPKIPDVATEHFAGTKIDPIVTLYYFAEAFMAAATTFEEIAERREHLLLDALLWQGGHIEIVDAIRKAADTLGARRREDKLFGSIECRSIHSPVGVASCVALDPVYGLDIYGADIARKSTAEGELVSQIKTAFSFRFQLTCGGPFWIVWNNALQACSKPLDGQTGSLFYRSLRKCTAEFTNSGNSLSILDVVETKLYPALSCIASVLDSFCARLAMDETSWFAVDEFHILEFFQAAERLCEFASTATCAQEDQLLYCIALMGILNRFVPGSSSNPIWSKVQESLLEANKDIVTPTITLVTEWAGKFSTPIPCSFRSVEIEQEILQILRKWPDTTWSRNERKIFSQALVTISSRESEVKQSLLEAVSTAPSLITRNRLECLPVSPCDFASQTTSPMNPIRKLLLLDAMTAAVSIWSTYVDGSEALRDIDVVSSNGYLCRALQDCLVPHQLSISGMVPFQRILWLAETFRTQPQERISPAHHSEIQGSIVEALTVLLKQYTFYGNEQPLSPVRPSVLCSDIDITMSGSELTVKSLEYLELSSQNLTIENTGTIVQDSALAAQVLLGGCVGPLAPLTTKWNFAKALLIISLSQLLGCPTGQLSRSEYRLTSFNEFMPFGSEVDLAAAENVISNWAETHRVLARNAIRTVAMAVAEIDKTEVTYSLESVDGVLLTFGRAWAAIGLANVAIISDIITRMPCDPGALAKAEYDVFTDLLSRTTSKYIAYWNTERLRFGQLREYSNYPLLESGRQSSKLLSRQQASRKRMVHRPKDSSSFPVLQSVVRRLATTFGNCASELDIARQYFEIYNGTLSVSLLSSVDREANALNESLSSVCDRLEFGGDLGHMRDIGGSVVLGMREIQFGMLLCAKATGRSVISKSKKDFGSHVVARELMLFPRASYHSEFTPAQLLALCIKNSMNPSLILIVIQFLAVHMEADKNEFAAITSGFAHLVNVWKSQILRVETETDREKSVYRMRSALEEAIFADSVRVNDECESAESDFKGTFDISSGPVDTQVQAESRRLNSKDELAISGSSLWCLYEQIMCESKMAEHWLSNSSTEERDILYKDVLKTVASLVHSHTSPSLSMPVCADISSPAGFLSSSYSLLHVLGGELKFGSPCPSSQAAGSDGLYNFYVDCNFPEVLDGVKTLNELVQAARHVQSAHFGDSGEHPVLAGVITAAARAAKLESHKPLGSLVGSFEGVLKKAVVWQRLYANKSIKLDREVQHVAATIERWRKLETASWMHLLNIRIADAERRGHVWFPYLHDAMFTVDVHESHLSSDLLSTLDQFLRSSPTGEFQTRLKILNALACHLSAQARLESRRPPKLATFLNGLTSFYGLYSHDARVFIESAKTPLESQVSENVALAKWRRSDAVEKDCKSTNDQDRDLEYERWRSSGEHMRRKLHKICRAMDVALRSPVSELILARQRSVGLNNLLEVQSKSHERGMSKATLHDASLIPNIAIEIETVKTSVASLFAGHEALLRNVPTVNHLKSSSRLLRLPNLCDRMQRICFAAPSSVGHGCTVISNLREAVLHRVRALRKSSSESIQLKKKALVDLLRGLKLMGLSPNPSSAAVIREGPAFWLAVPDFLPAENPLFGICRDTYFLSAQNLLRLREAISGNNLHSDITRRESTCMLAFCSHLLDLFVAEKKQLSETISLCISLSRVAKHLSCAVISNSFAKNSDKNSLLRPEIRANGNTFALALHFYRRLASTTRDFEVLRAHITFVSKQCELRRCDFENADNTCHSEWMQRNNTSGLHAANIVSEACEYLLQFRAITTELLKDCLQTSPSADQTFGHYGYLNEKQQIAFDGIVHAMLDLCEKIVLLQGKASCLQPGNIAKAVLDPVANFLKTAVTSLNMKHGALSGTGADDFEKQVASLAEKVVDSVLVGAQQISRREKGKHVATTASSRTSTESADEVLDDILPQAHEQTCTFVHTVNLRAIQEQTLMLSEKLNGAPELRSCDVAETLARAAGYFVCRFIDIVVIPAVSEHISFYLNGIQLLKTLTSLFVGLCSDGYCRPLAAETSGVTCDEIGTQDGTGFGEVGDGDASLAKDVSEEIEEEGQLADLEGNKKNDNNGEDEKLATADIDFGSGFDMENDFEGDVFSLPDDFQRESDENQANENESSLPAEETLESSSEVGENVIDERLWDEDEGLSTFDGKTDDSRFGRGEFNSDGHAPEAELVGRATDHDPSEPSRTSKRDSRANTLQNSSQDVDPKDGDCESFSDCDGASTANGSPLQEPINDMGPNKDLTKESTQSLSEDAGHDNPEEVGSLKASEKSFDGAEPRSDDLAGDQPSFDINECGESHLTNNNNCESLSGDEVEGMKPTEGEDSEEMSRGDGNRDGDNHDEFLEEANRDSIGLQDPEKSDDQDLGKELPCNDGRGDCPQHLDGEMPSDTVNETPDAATGCDEPLELQSEQTTNGVYLTDGSNILGTESQRQGSEEREMALGTVGGLMSGLNWTADKAPSQTNSTEISNGGEKSGEPKKDGIGYSLESETIRPGTHGPENENETSDPMMLEPNPHRLVADDILSTQWIRRLQTLQDSAPTDDVTGFEDNHQQGHGELEFLNDASNFDDGGDMKTPRQYAIGAATTEQQKPVEDISCGNDSDDFAAKPENEGMYRQRYESQDRHTVKKTNTSGEPDGSNSELPVPENLAEKEAQGKVANANKEIEPTISKYVEEHTPETCIGTVALNRTSRDVDMDANVENVQEFPIQQDESSNVCLNSIYSEIDEMKAITSWRELESITTNDAAILCEQLRLVLEPSLKTGLAGDFRTGKRLNMRRVIEYVASDFRRDRIWLRRVRPERRCYDVLIAIDDSQSMSESGAGPLALKALALLSAALGRLEVGRVAVAKFGSEAVLVRGFDEPLPMDSRAGGRVLSEFSFSQRDTNLKLLLDLILNEMTGLSSLSRHDYDDVKLAFVVSDGRLTEREQVHRRIFELQSRRVLVALIIVDSTIDNRKSIFELKKVEYDDTHIGKVKVTPFMEKFPVDFYAVVKHVSALPLILADGLRQWFEHVNSAS